ncbi:MAG: DUF5916 domain-containing protein, partial [Cyclobacteriaceae bacterium]|nr:DUF5916 domain-containing protein [Cyclobacteriaceae bacterium]
LDTYNDNENGLCFMTSPTGIRLDMGVFNDAQGAMPLNPSWNTFWDVKSVLEGKRWRVEMRIPFTSLRFQEKDGEVKMGVIVWWWMAGKAKTLAFPSIPREWGPWSAFKPSKAKDIVFYDIQPKKPVYIAPYVIGGVQAEQKLNALETGYEKGTDFIGNIGLDAKITLSEGWSLDLTANTDFAQVEADDQQVNLTRFSIFFPEKRMFFQERASIFSFNTGGFNTLFYSRRIGLDADRNIVPIYGGARAIGRSGKWDIGLLNMQTGNSDAQSSTNYGVLRVRRQVSESNSYLGTMITNRIDLEGNYNTAIGIDGIFNINKSVYLSVNAAQILDTALNNSLSNNSKIYTNLQKRNTDGWGYDLTFARIGDAFNPEMGFELRRNNLQFTNRIWHGWIGGQESKFLNGQLYLRNELFKNISDGINDSEMLGGGFQFQLKTGQTVDVSFSGFKEYLRDTFNVYDSYVVPGSYSHQGLEMQLSTGGTKRMKVDAVMYTGTFFDGRNTTINLRPSWKPNSTFSLDATYQIINLIFEDKNRNSVVSFISLKPQLYFSTKLSAALTAQYNDFDQKINSNLRIRFNPKEGNDLYIVYNDIENTNLYRQSITLPQYQFRTLLVKYIYTFVY